MGGGHFVTLRLTFNSNFVIAFNQDRLEKCFTGPLETPFVERIGHSW